MTSRNCGSPLRGRTDHAGDDIRQPQHGLDRGSLNVDEKTGNDGPFTAHAVNVPAVPLVEIFAPGLLPHPADAHCNQVGKQGFHTDPASTFLFRLEQGSSDDHHSRHVDVADGRGDLAPPRLALVSPVQPLLPLVARDLNVSLVGSHRAGSQTTAAKMYRPSCVPSIRMLSSTQVCSGNSPSASSASKSGIGTS